MFVISKNQKNKLIKTREEMVKQQEQLQIMIDKIDKMLEEK